MTKVELAEKLARECGSDILDDPLGIAEAMDQYDLTCDWQEMEALIRAALNGLNPGHVTEQAQDDRTKADILDALTLGRPYVLLSMEPTDSGITLSMDAGGGINNRAEVEDFMEAALRYLRGK